MKKNEGKSRAIPYILYILMTAWKIKRALEQTTLPFNFYIHLHARMLHTKRIVIFAFLHRSICPNLIH